MHVILISGSPRARGFTFVEMHITLALFLVLVAGVVSSQMFGLKLCEFVKPKLAACDDARKTLNLLIDDVRSARRLRIGNGNATAFTETGIDALQQGSALQVYPNTDTNQFIRYYRDPEDGALKRIESGKEGISILATSITNQLVFSSEDYHGTIITNNQNNHVIGLTLQFERIQYPIVEIGPGKLYDFYQVRTKITRRAIL